MSNGGVPRPLLAVAAVGLTAGCHVPDTSGQTPPAPAPEGEFSELFRQVAAVHLEEPPGTVVGSVDGVADGGDRFAVVEAEGDRVFVYGPDGAFQGLVGGSGDGPGEMRVPRDAEFLPDGRLAVAEVGSRRVHLFGPDLTVDTIFRVREATGSLHLAGLGDDELLVYVFHERLDRPRLHVYGTDGRRRRAFHPTRPEYQQVPYWNAAVRSVMAVVGDRIVAGGSLRYPFPVYDRSGRLLDSLGVAPPNWEPAPELERGRFAVPDARRRFARWRRTFTTVSDLVPYRDEYLLVVHRRLDPEVLAYEVASYEADVYRADGTKLAREIPLPGPVLEGERNLWILTGKPPGGWELTRYELRASALEGDGFGGFGDEQEDDP